MKISNTFLLFFLLEGVNAFSVHHSQKACCQSTSTSTSQLMTVSMVDGSSLGDRRMDEADSNVNSSSKISSISTSSSSSSSKKIEQETVLDWDWKQLANDVFDTDKRPIVLFDGVCNLCNGGVNFAIDQDESAKFRFCSLQSKVAQSLLLRSGKSLDDKSNIALVSEDDVFFSSDAVSRICMELDAKPLQWFGVLGQFTPNWIRESIYDFVSENRYQFGENDSCRLDFDGTYTSRFVSDPLDDDQ